MWCLWGPPDRLGIERKVTSGQSALSLLRWQRHAFPTLRRGCIHIESAHDVRSSLAALRILREALLYIFLLAGLVPSTSRRRIKTDTRATVLTFSSGQICGGAARQTARGTAQGLADVPLALLREPEEDGGRDCCFVSSVVQER